MSKTKDRHRMLRRNPDTGKTIAWVALGGATAYGIYKLWISKAGQEVEPGTWASSGIILDKIPFTISITEAEVGDWLPSGSVLDIRQFSILIREPEVGDWLPAGSVLDVEIFSIPIREVDVGGWLPAYTTLDRAPFTISIETVEPPLYVSFRMNIDGDAAGHVFYEANRWTCYYYDPELEKFIEPVGGANWRYLFSGFDFENVVSGGYLAVFLYSTVTETMSEQFTSPTWDAIDNHTYEYNPETNRIINI